MRRFTWQGGTMWYSEWHGAHENRTLATRRHKLSRVCLPHKCNPRFTQNFMSVCVFFSPLGLVNLLFYIVQQKKFQRVVMVSIVIGTQLNNNNQQQQSNYFFFYYILMTCHKVLRPAPIIIIIQFRRRDNSAYLGKSVLEQRSNPLIRYCGTRSSPPPPRNSQLIF